MESVDPATLPKTEEKPEEAKVSDGNSDPVSFKIQVNIRIRPQNAGISDLGATDSSDSVQQFKSVESDKICFTNSKTGKDSDTFTYMAHNLPDDLDNGGVYDKMMPFFIDKFAQGFNVNFLCYGQTGSGKTYTALGPPGTFKPGVELTGEVEPHFGMFPRAALEIFKIAEARGSLITVALAQDYFKQISCMINNKEVKVDPRLNILIGLSEILCDTPQKLLEVCKTIDLKRITGKTGMNALSSRSHFMIQLKMYTKVGEKIQVNYLKFMDMAGSERVSKTGLDPMSIEGLQANYINFSITTFTRVLEQMSRMKPLTGGQELNKTISWKESTITKMMKSCFDGTAFSSFIICISSAPKNSGESHHAMKFGQAAASLSSNVTKPVPVSLESTLKISEEVVVKLEKQKKDANETTAKRLAKEIDIENVKIDIFKKLQAQ